MAPVPARDAALERQRYSDYGGDDDRTGPGGGGLLEYWRILQRRKGTVILIAFLGALAGVFYTLPQPPVYQARTLIEIQSMNDNFMHMADINPTRAGSSYFPEVDIQTQVRILQSRSMIDRVVRKLKLDKQPVAVQQSRLAAWRNALNLAPVKPAGREQAIAAASGSLKVRAQPNTRLVEISCDSASPKMAADFANALSTEFIDQNLEARWQATQHTGEWLTGQLESVKIKLEKAEDELQSYARETGLLFTNEKDNIAELKLKQLQEEISRAQADRISRQSRYELASKAPAESVAEVLDDPGLKEIQGKLTDLRRQLADLSSSFQPAHPKVKKIQAQIVTLESALQHERANILNRIHNDFESAQRREKLLTADYATSARLMTGQADKVAHYNILKREVDTTRQLYDSMLQKVKEAGVASALRASNVRVVDPATVPAAPYKPSLVTNTALGLMCGLFLGIAFVVFRDRADCTIQEPGDVSYYLGVPELGLIPSASSDPAVKRSRGKALALSTSGDPAASVGLAVWQQKPSAVAESFRAAIASIMFSGKNGNRPQVIVISSATPAEGKTTVAANLAIALAEINQRVLLIDADMRRPRLHGLFGVDNSTGVVDVLRRTEPFNTALNGLAKQTQVPNLWILPSGPSGHSDPALLYSNRLAELIRQVREHYDTVLVDTPPMLSMADSRIIGRASDAVILVVRANQTTKEALQDACSRFNEDGTPLLGTILNDWNPKHSTHYSYYHYYDKYKDHYRPDK
jgi:polysaccharide biosynthesis transport protein